MGEWGKWWSSRGKDTVVKCTFCGRNVPKHKAVQINTGGRLSRDIYEVAEYVSMASSKGHACISCAKHRHIVKDGVHTTEKDKRMKKRAQQKREMDKVMQKVKEIERKERAATKDSKSKDSSKDSKQKEEKPKKSDNADEKKPESKKIKSEEKTPKTEKKAE